MFNQLDESSQEVVIDAMDEKFFKPGDTVISQGDSGEELYVVEEGKLSCSKIFVRCLSITYLGRRNNREVPQRIQSR